STWEACCSWPCCFGVIPPRKPLAPRLVIQLRDEAAPFVAIELNDHVDDHAEQPLDLAHAQPAARAALADHECHLLEGQRAAAGMDAGDASGVAGGGQAHEREAFGASHLRQEDAVWLHAQASLQQ